MILFFTSGFLILGYLYLLSLLYNEFVFFGVQGGVNAVTMCRYEFIPQITGMASSSTNASINQWNLDFIDEINKQVASGGLLSPSESSNVLTQYGLDFCLNHPLESIAILILKLIFFWRPSVVFGAYSPEVFWVSILFMLPTVIGGLIYIYKQFRSVPKANRAFKLILILLAIGDASILITPLQIRHRVAMFDVVLILFAARLFQQKYDDIMHLVARKCKANRE
jgi:hypothetical protein